MALYEDKEKEEDDLYQKKKEQEQQKMLKRMRKERKERKKNMRARRARLDGMEKEKLMRWKEKEKKHGMVGMGERARTAREKWMDHQEHEVMLNLSIMAGKLSDDWLVEERRTPIEMFWKCWDSKQIERSRLGNKQREEVKKIVNRDC